MKNADFFPPTTYEGALEMVKALDPDVDSTTADKYRAYDKLKLFFRLMLPLENS